MTRPVPISVTFSKTLLLTLAAAALVLPGCSSGSSKAVMLTTSNFEEKVLKSKQPVLVDFWAEWCPPCKEMDPIIRELAADFEGKAIIGKVNADDYPDIVAKYRIDSFPSFLVFKDGELKRRIKGVAPKHYLSDLLGALQ